MKEGLTELVFIVDRSGSMEGLEAETITGFNAMLREQSAINGDAFVTTVLFDDKCELLHDRVNIKSISPLAAEDYTVGGGTALLDAVGKSINKIRLAQKHTAEDFRAERVLFAIITDGMENASRKFKVEGIRGRIERLRNKYGWEFIFLGANVDAVAEAAKLGISADRAQLYQACVCGTCLAWSAISAASSAFRSGGALDGWSDVVGECVCDC